MKKTFSVSALCFGLFLSAGAFAATEGDVAPGSSTTVNPTACTLLSNDVNLLSSKGVNGAWRCGTSVMVAGACSDAGSNKSQTITCSWTAQTSSAGTIYTPNATGCAATPTATATSVTITGRKAYAGISSGGKVSDISIGATCSGSVLRATTTFTSVN